MSREELSTSVYAFVVVCCLHLTMEAAVINTPTNALTPCHCRLEAGTMVENKPSSFTSLSSGYFCHSNREAQTPAVSHGQP